MNSKDLDNVPIRCQRLLMRLMRFNAIAVADALSWGPEQRYGDGASHDDVAAHIDAIISQVPATPKRIDDKTKHS